MATPGGSSFATSAARNDHTVVFKGGHIKNHSESSALRLGDGTARLWTILRTGFFFASIALRVATGVWGAIIRTVCFVLATVGFALVVVIASAVSGTVRSSFTCFALTVPVTSTVVCAVIGVLTPTCIARAVVVTATICSAVPDGFAASCFASSVAVTTAVALTGLSCFTSIAGAVVVTGSAVGRTVGWAFAQSVAALWRTILRAVRCALAAGGFTGAVVVATTVLSTVLGVFTPSCITGAVVVTETVLSAVVSVLTTTSFASAVVVATAIAWAE